MPGNVRMQRTLLCQALFMDILKVPGKVRMKSNFLPGNFCMEILKVSGIVRMQRTLFSRHFLWKKVPGKVRKWRTLRQNYKDHVICICLFHGNWTVQYHEQRQRLVCALYTYLQSLSLLVKLSDLLLLANLAKMSLFTHFGEMSWFTRFLAFW